MNLIETLQKAGFKGEALRQAWAIAMRESGGRAKAFNGNTGTGDRSYGLFQINMLGGLGPARMKKYGLKSEKDLLDPLTNARVAYQMSNGGKNWFSWDIDENGYNGGSHKPAYEQWYKKYPGPKDTGGADVGGGTKPKVGKDGALKTDPLNRAELKRDYQAAFGAIYSVPELRDLFKEAVKGKWETSRLDVMIKNSNWYMNHDEQERQALAAKALGGDDWDRALDEGRNMVQQEATRIGVKLNGQQIDHLAEEYQMRGWAQGDRKMEMSQAIAQFIGEGEGDYMQGESGNLQQDLMDIAYRNGLKISKEYAQSAAKSVMSGWSTADDWKRQTREQAASIWGPHWQEQIMSGVDAKDLASGYINMMASTFEMTPDTISLDDPYLRKAMTRVDEKGQAAPQSLYDFQTDLRSSEQWKSTKQFADQTADIGSKILKMFGFTG